MHDPLHDGVPEAARAEDADGAVKAEELQAWPNAVEAGAAGGAVVSKADGADFSEGAAAGSNVQRTIVPAAKVRPTQGGKGMDWRVWPGGPPGTGSGIGDFGSGQSESWGFYDRADQVDALLAYLNPQVEACSTLSLLLLQSIYYSSHLLLVPVPLRMRCGGTPGVLASTCWGCALAGSAGRTLV